ncbi:MAG: hypothetical protein ACHREM_11240 [Polyangiales bacterium]
MRRGSVAREVVEMCLDARAPDVSDDDRKFAAQVVVDLLPLLIEEVRAKLLPDVMKLVALLPTWSRPTHALRPSVPPDDARMIATLNDWEAGRRAAFAAAAARLRRR